MHTAQHALDNVELSILMPLDGVFLLNVSELNGTDVLASGQEDAEYPGYAWNEVLCDSSEITITRGLNLNANAFAVAEASECIAVIHGPTVDPLANDRVAPNAPMRVRVLVDDTWETLFFGRVRQMIAQYSKDRKASVTFTAYDLIRRLANIVSTAPTQQTFANRLTTLATTGGTTVTTTGGMTTLAPKASNASVWDIMNIAATSEGGFVYANRQGTLEARGRNATPGSNVIEFSDIHGAYDDHFSTEFQIENPLHSCYTDIDISYDTTNVYNSLTISNIAGVDDEGEDVATKMPVYTDIDSIEGHGEVNANLLTNLVDTTAVEALRDYIFTNFADPVKRVNSVTFNPDAYWQTLVDVGDYAGVVFHNSSGSVFVDSSFLITGVTHKIYPEGWTMELSLFGDAT